jgi:hypothetical protein
MTTITHQHEDGGPKYSRPYSSDSIICWESRERNVTPGTIRMIAGNLYHGEILYEGLLPFDKPYIWWRPVHADALYKPSKPRKSKP